MYIPPKGQDGRCCRAVHPFVAVAPSHAFIGDMSALLVVTDIDGTLLRFDDYDIGPAADSLAACLAASIPVVLCSSKSRAEQLTLRERFGLQSPFVVENGAAIYLPADQPVADAARQLGAERGWHLGEISAEPIEMPEGTRAGVEIPSRLLVEVVLGTERERLSVALGELSARTGLPLRGLSAMDQLEVAGRLGLTNEEAAQAMTRGFSEPFSVELETDDTGDTQRLDWLGRLRPAAEDLGLRCTLGDRLFHLQGQHSKGTAVEQLVDCYERALGARPHTVGLGDSYNDAEMLEVVDEPVLVRRHDGSFAAGIDLPGLLRTEGEGPEGWHEAVSALLMRRQTGRE